MSSIELYRTVSDELRSQVTDLVSAVEAADSTRFLSDHLWLDLQSGPSGPRDDWLAAGARLPDGSLAAYAQASAANEGVVIESACHPRARGDDQLERRLLETLLAGLTDGSTGDGRTDGSGHVHVTWWVHDVAERHDALAAALGMSPVRDLYQMRRPLPTGLDVTVTTRVFDPGRDEAEWVRVNNRAFAEHGEQGGWTVETLRQREQESWFEPDGFRIHERDGRIAAFCWTKLHPASDSDPALGEIYVIGVDPDFQGLGLGKQLTLAGLDAISDRGVNVGMLYVDAGNTPAVTMYHALDFTVHRTDRAYSAALIGTPVPTSGEQLNDRGA